MAGAILSPIVNMLESGSNDSHASSFTGEGNRYNLESHALLNCHKVFKVASSLFTKLMMRRLLEHQAQLKAPPTSCCALAEESLDQLNEKAKGRSPQRDTPIEKLMNHTNTKQRENIDYGNYNPTNM